MTTNSQFLDQDRLSFLCGDGNKEVNRNAMQQNILTKVIYPTGGYSKYEYEPHRFNGSVFQEGGGLRVKKITTKESNTSSEIVSEYRYGVNESGLGICTMEPVPSSFFQEMLHYVNFLKEFYRGCDYGYRQVTMFADSKISSYTAFNPDVWYDTVTEYGSEGKTVYNFEYEADQCLAPTFHTIVVTSYNDQTRPLVGYFNNLFRQGPKLRYKKVYKKETTNSYRQIEEEETQYVTKTQSPFELEGLYVEQKIYCDEFSQVIYDWTGKPYYTNGLALSSFACKSYKININTEKVSATIKKLLMRIIMLLNKKPTTPM